MDLKPGQYIEECSFFDQCVACGQRYRPRYLKDYNDIRICICVSDHHCDPKRLARVKAKQKEQSPYCECDDLDCKFEYLEEMMNEMQ